MDQVHVIRHKVLVEGRSQRAGGPRARDFAGSRCGSTWRRPRRCGTEAAAAAAPGLGEGRGRGSPRCSAESAQWTGGKQRLTATRLAPAARGPKGTALGATLVKAAVAEGSASGARCSFR